MNMTRCQQIPSKTCKLKMRKNSFKKTQKSFNMIVCQNQNVLSTSKLLVTPMQKEQNKKKIFPKNKNEMNKNLCLCINFGPNNQHHFLESLRKST